MMMMSAARPQGHASRTDNDDGDDGDDDDDDGDDDGDDDDDVRRATTRSRKSDRSGLPSLLPLIGCELHQRMQRVDVGPLPVDDLVLAEDFVVPPFDFVVPLLELRLEVLDGLQQDHLVVRPPPDL